MMKYKDQKDIVSFPKAISTDLCQKIIDFFEKDPNKHKTASYYQEDTGMSNNRNAMEVLLWPGSTLEDEFYKQFRPIVEAYTDIYKGGYPNFLLDEGFCVVRYTDGGCDPHTDAVVQNTELSTVRFCTVIIYLNDCKGGETVFPRQKVKVKCEQGKVVLFPSGHTHPHQGNKPKKGQTKYALVSWIKWPGEFTYYNKTMV